VSTNEPGCRVLLADDNAFVRDALEPALRRWGCTVVGVRDTADGLVEFVVRERPDVLILDLDMPGRSPLHLIEDLRLREHPTRILVYSALGDQEIVRQCLEGGVRGYVLKADPPGSLREALNAVLGGGRYLSPGVARPVADDGRGPLELAEGGSAACPPEST